MLAASLDLPPYEKIIEAEVTGEADSPSTDLLAAWLTDKLKVSAKRFKATSGEGIVQVTLDRASGPVDLLRPDGKVGTLSQPGQPSRRVALQRRSIRDCLAEELRRLDPDEVYAAALKSLAKVSKGRTPSAKPADEAPAEESANGKAAAPAAKKSKAKASS
jgi:glucose-6-phosphate dehydrogenase assembly protein OpcA